MIELLFIATLLLCLLYLGQISTVLISWQQTPSWQSQRIHVPKHSLTVIVAARNEAQNISDCLTSIMCSCDYLQQVYPSTSVAVLVGDDHSTDFTYQLASQYVDDRLEVLQMPAAVQGKKAVLRYLADYARGDYLVFTDADCKVSEGWLLSLSSFLDRSQCVAVTALVRTPPSYRWIDHWQYLDIIGMMAMTAHGLYRGTFTLANGANMAVERAVYLEVANSSVGSDYASGDDVFVMQQIKALYGDRVRFFKSYEAIVETATQSSWSELWQQRKRWATKTTGYQETGVIRLQGFAWVYCLLILASFIAAPWTGGVSVFTGLLLLLVKMTIDYMLLSQVADFYGYRRPFKAYVFVATTHLLYIVAMGFVALLPSKYRWKGRQVQ